MKPLLFVKASTVIMGILILAGFGLIAYKVSEKNTSRKVKNAHTAVLIDTVSASASFSESGGVNSNSTTVFPNGDTTNHTHNVSLRSDEQIQNVISCAPYICVWIAGQPRSDKLWIISPQTGTIHQRMHFNKNEK